MIKSFITVFLMFFSLSARALPAQKTVDLPKNKIWISPLVYNSQLQRNNEQELQLAQSSTFAISYTRNTLEFLLEYSLYGRNSSGNQTSNIETQKAEWNLWLRFLNIKHSAQDPWSLYLGLAAGIYERQVTTTFMGDSRIDSSGKKPQLGAKLGVEYKVPFVNSNWEMQVRIEGRAFYGQDLEPNPTSGAQGNLGFAYSF